MSRIDYCNSILSGVNDCSLDILQRIQNNAARLVCKKKKADHISPLLVQLHWLPVAKRILYKLDIICYKALNNSAPDYLINLLNVYKPSRNLRSVSDPLSLQVPRTKLSTFGPRAFSVSVPLSWSQLPLVRSPLSHHLRLFLRLTCFPLFDVVSPCTVTCACLCFDVCDW